MRNSVGSMMPSILLRSVAVAVALASALPCCVAAGYVVEGRVVSVRDGDTITILDSQNVQHKIRLSEIDAPELKQPHGQDAKAALSKMVFGKSVTVNVSTRDRYGREIGNVLLGDVDVNGSMVRWGWCWVYREYKHRKEVEQYEAEAREKKRGLWADDKKQVPPWDWRKGKKVK